MIWNLQKSLFCIFDQVPFKTSCIILYNEYEQAMKPSWKSNFFLICILYSIENFGHTVWHTCLPAILNQPSNQPLTCLITRIYWSFPMNLRITTNSSQCQLKLPKEIFCNLPSIDLPSFTVRGPARSLAFSSLSSAKKITLCENEWSLQQN